MTEIEEYTPVLNDDEWWYGVLVSNEDGRYWAYYRSALFGPYEEIEDAWARIIQAKACEDEGNAIQ